MEARGFGFTHVGGREQNEDAYLVDDTLGLYIVADGMGGYEGGEIASRTVVGCLHRFYEFVGEDGDVGFDTTGSGGRSVAEDMMRLAVRQASHEIEKMRQGQLASMGSTVATLLMRRDKCLIAHAGDSRVYRMRRGRMTQITRDHSLYAELLEAGVVSARAVASRNTITRAVGVPGYWQPDVRIDAVQPGDTYVLCSDGLTDALDDGDIAEMIADLEPELAAWQLVQQAWTLAGEDSDNVTCVVVRAA